MCYVTLLELYESKLNEVRSGSQDYVVEYLTGNGSAVSKWKHLLGLIEIIPVWIQTVNFPHRSQ
jgi:hypothetical protein